MIAAAGTFGLIWLFSLSRNLFDPVGNDEAAYQFMAEMILGGQQDPVVRGHVKYAAALVFIRSLGTLLTGTSFLGIRLFDMFWQLATMAALVGFAVRDGRRWSVGFLAATLYSVGYYGMHHLNVGGRDSFVVLPMLLLLHAVLSAYRAAPATRRAFIWYAAAGVLGFCAYVVKFPYGLCYGLFWIGACGYAIRQRVSGFTDTQRAAGFSPRGSADRITHAQPGNSARAEERGYLNTSNWRAAIPVAGLTVGFVLTTAAWIVLMLAIGWWDSPWILLTDDHPKGYTVGHWLMLDLAGGAMAAGAVAVGLALAATTIGRTERVRSWLGAHGFAMLQLAATAVATYVLLMSLREWNSWRGVVLPIAGLLVPAFGAMMLSDWRNRSSAWRIMAITTLATLGVIILQGRFWLYHFVPLIACLSYLGAVETADLLSKFATLSTARRAWLAICIGAVMQVGVGHWWRTMTLNGYALDVRGQSSLEAHYDRMCDTRSFVPAYTTMRQVADRIQQLTAPHEPISCLFLDARLYKFAHRPMAHHLMFMGAPTMDYYYPQFMQTLVDRRPKVVVARIPATCTTSDPTAIADAIFTQTESFYGPPGRLIRENFQLRETIGDLALLSPR